MRDFQKAKIYRRTKEGEKPYIGSTTLPLGSRCATHNYRFGGGFKMELIEDYPCNSNEELRKRERYWAEQEENSNIRIPYRSAEEKKQQVEQYHQTERRKEYMKKYNEKRNKTKEYVEYKKNYQKEYYLSHKPLDG